MWIYKVGSCLESLKGAGCGLNWACAKAGIELYYVPFLFKTFKNFWLSKTLRMAFRSQLGSQGTFSDLGLFSFIKLSYGQAKPRNLFKGPTAFYCLWNFAYPHLLTWNAQLPLPTKFYFFLENKVKWHLFYDAPGSLMSLLPEVLLHFVLSLFKPSINSLRIGTVPYMRNWNKNRPIC